MAAASSGHIVVVGAGVCGLTSALRLLQAGHSVTVVADYFDGITSKTAPSAFRPTKWPQGDNSDERLIRWGRASHEAFTELFRAQGSKAGLTMLTTIEPFDTELYKTVGGADILSKVCTDFRSATSDELAAWCPHRGRGWDGVVYSGFTIEGSKFLPYLLERIEELGGKVVKATVEGAATSAEWCQAATLAAGHPEARIVVNCCGLRGGTDCTPLRGTLVLVKAPWLRWAVCNYDTKDREKPTWIVPRETHVMLGTSKFVGGKEAMLPDEEEETAKHIIDRCAEFVPAIRDAPIISTVTCVRPVRAAGPRVDSVRAGAYHCVNNYGHGTVGATYSWGCAADVTDLVKTALVAPTPVSRL